MIMTTMKRIVEARWFANSIIVLIIFNAITLGAETFSLQGNIAQFLYWSNVVCTTIFVIELIMKLLVYRKSFFSEKWNVFDLIVVSLSLLPAATFLSSARALRVVRVFRVFRAARLIGHMEAMRRVIAALFRALPSIGWTVGILGLIDYIYAVIGTNLFQDISPDYFGNLWRTFYTLFQMTTADDLGAITRPIISEDPASVIYFVSFVIIAVFLVLNLVIGVVVNSIEEISQQADKEERIKNSSELELELEKLEDHIELIRSMLQDARAEDSETE